MMNDRHLWEEPDCPQTVRLDPSVNISIDPFPDFGYLTTALAPLMYPLKEEAAAVGTYVAAHAYMPSAISRAVQCGVRRWGGMQFRTLCSHV